MDDDVKRKNNVEQQNKPVSIENAFYDLEANKKIRQTFRVPVEKGDNVKVIIRDIEYDVIDVANKGVGIRITKLDKFTDGEIIKPLRVIINEKTFRLEGKIIHVTPDGPDTSLCGIEFINMPPGSREMLLEYLQKYGNFDMDSVF